MKSLTNVELELIEKALEMKVLIYECYGVDKKREKALNDYRCLLLKVKSRLKLRRFL